MMRFAFFACLFFASHTYAAPTDTALGKKNKKLITEVLLDTLEITAPAAPPSYQFSHPRAWEITLTHCALEFDCKAKTAHVREYIDLHPYFYATDTLELDAKTIRFDSVCLVVAGHRIPLLYTTTDTKLVIKFERLMQKSDNIQLFLKYTSMPYAAATGGSAAITDDRGLYFINTDNSIRHKPSQIWTQGETEANSHWMVTIDKPNSRFKTIIELTVPDSMATLSNGALVKQQPLPGKMRKDIWKMDQPIQAYAVMFAVGKYSIIKDKWKNKEVNYYVEPEYAPYARLMFRNTVSMIDFFSDYTGVPYPWNKYSQVVARDYVSGAMENTSASLFGEFMNQNPREIADKNSEDVVSHELFHQWFGDYVTAESWSNITVNESFANYGEQLWGKHQYGKDYADELAWTDLQRYIQASAGKDPQLVRFYYDNREEVFDAISYNKGGATLRYLHSILGDEAFRLSIKTYLTTNALHSAEAHQWRLAIEQATGLDWNWFFNEWYYHAGHPVLKVSYKYIDSASKLEVTVNQTQNDSAFVYELPIQCQLVSGNTKSLVEWHITKRKQTFTYNYVNGTRPVLIPDFQHVLPGEIKENKKGWQWLAQFKASDDYPCKKLALNFASKQPEDSIAKEIIALGLQSNLKSIRAASLGILKSITTASGRAVWHEKVLNMAARDSSSDVRGAAFEVIRNWEIAGARPVIAAAVYDSSYVVSGKALAAMAKFDKDTALWLARQFLCSDPKTELKKAAWDIIADAGHDDDIYLFETYAEWEIGNKKYAFCINLNKYLENVKGDVSFERGLKLLEKEVTSEDQKRTKTYLQNLTFELAKDTKSESKTIENPSAELAGRRLDRVKATLQVIIDEEQDEKTKDALKTRLKDIFEG